MNTPTLPPIGRPNKSGLSPKMLGQTEYVRRLRALNKKPSKKCWWTGMTGTKNISRKDYMRQYRKLLAELDSNFLFVKRLAIN